MTELKISDITYEELLMCQEILDEARGENMDCKVDGIPFSRYEVYQELLKRLA